MADDGAESKKGWLWRLAGGAALLFNLVRLPLRLFWENYFRSIGVLCFIGGLIAGAFLSSGLRRRLATRGMIICGGVLLLLVLAFYALFTDSVDQVEPAGGYSLSSRQFWETFLYGVINFCWGLFAEVAARRTTALGRSDRE